MSIFQANISLLNKFLKQFASCFSKKQMAMFTLLIYALFKDDKRNSIDAMAKATHTDYQKFQYFFSDSKWDLQAIKRTRLEIIQKQKTMNNSLLFYILNSLHEFYNTINTFL